MRKSVKFIKEFVSENPFETILLILAVIGLLFGDPHVEFWG